MTASIPKFTLTLHEPPFKVSNLSSLFRSLQAAVRETAAAGQPVENLFSNQEGPFLVADLSNTNKDGLVLSLWFADRNDAPLEERSEETFSRAFDELENTVTSGSQHTFWGAPAYPSDWHYNPSRMMRFITVLRPFRSATIVYRDRVLVLRDGFFASEGG